MITQEQADTATVFHLRSIYGDRCLRWRRNGRTKRWKRTPLRFEIPLKHGLYDYGRIADRDVVLLDRLHVEQECPYNDSTV